MSEHGIHSEWLSLVPASGPFLAPPVLDKAFPQGLDTVDVSVRKDLRQAYAEWREAIDLDDPDMGKLHRAWIDLVLRNALEFDDDVLKANADLPDDLKYRSPEHGVELRPDFAVTETGAQGKARLLITVYPPGTDLDAVSKVDLWPASPAERMTQLCRAMGVRLGLLTNGERWLLIDAPVGGVATYANWHARLWGQEPITLQAFVSLLGIRRFFAEPERTLEYLLDESLKHQEEVTDALGEQVRRAVEVLIQALDRADQDRDRELLHDVGTAELYEAGLTVMMRLVFLLCAEERGLLLLGEEGYDAHYAISTLRMQLHEDADSIGVEVLERRKDAWSRLLATFRAVYGGIEHEALRLPALGGSLFDPDRFPFLEGRAKGTYWRDTSAEPLPIDNRTVLLMLDAIQLFQGRTLSYRALDVEQIGYVYEGLLEQTVKRVDEVTLDLQGTKSAKNPVVTLGALESARLNGEELLKEFLKERTKSSPSRITNDLERKVEKAQANRLLTACHNDSALAKRIQPYFHFLRTDRWGYPLVYPNGAFMVTTGTERRETGAHYTPKSLTEAIVAETLTPVAYVGPAEGKSREGWVLKSPSELLDLKICDPAMGSGAFLVQACRWLAERLVDAWTQAEAGAKFITIDGDVTSDVTREPMPRDADDRIVVARRLIAERCLYGVDINHLAVELAKLSLWLVTLAKGRPFGFLDHNLRCGDSLLGIHRLDQLTELSMTPGGKGQQRLFGKNIEQAIHEAIELRQRLREMPIRDIHDVEVMARLDSDARRRLEVSERIADAFIGEVFSTTGRDSNLETSLTSLSIQAGQAIEGNANALQSIKARARDALSVDLTDGGAIRHPFHWPIEFPEVFARQSVGFDAIVGNPPFLGGQRITGVMGTMYRDWLVRTIAEGRRGSADLVAYFFLRAYSLLRENGDFGLLAVNTIAEGDTRQVGLEALVDGGAVIYAAWPNEPWPGAAAVVTSRVQAFKGCWVGSRTLSGRSVKHISAFLSDREEWSPEVLKANQGIAFQGSIVLGMGFVLNEDEALRMIGTNDRNNEVIFPYLNGQDLSSDPLQHPSRYVINFWDWPEARAKTYEEPYRRVIERVRPEREALNEANSSGRRRKECWWQYGSDAKNLYHAIGRGSYFENHPARFISNEYQFETVLAVTRVSKYLNFALVPNTSIFTLDLFIFALNRFSDFALLQSNIFGAWAWSRGGRMKHDLRFSGSDVFETFPMPSRNTAGDLEELGREFHMARSELMAESTLGLTKITNMIHNPSVKDAKVEALRSLWSRIDACVAEAFGWSDIDLSHGYHEVGYRPQTDRLRYTISEAARVELLERLAELNRQRHKEEVAQAQHRGGTARSGGSSAPRRQTALSGVAVQTGLDFGNTIQHREDVVTPASGNQWGVIASDQILAWLEAHEGWFPKTVVLNGSGAAPESWDSALSELLADDFVEVRGEGDATRYRAKG